MFVFCPKNFRCNFLFLCVFILLFFCLYSSWQKQRYKIVVTGLNACTGPVSVTTNATFLAELQQGQKLPGLIARAPNRLFDGCVIVTFGPGNSRKETQKLARIRTTWMKNHWSRPVIDRYVYINRLTWRHSHIFMPLKKVRILWSLSLFVSSCCR